MKTFGEEADSYLQKFYDSVGANTVQQKLALLEIKLGGTRNYYAFGGPVTDEMKVGCLEYELLERENLITLVLA